MSTLLRVLCRLALSHGSTVIVIVLLTGASVGARADCPGQVRSADTMGLDCNAQRQQEEQQRLMREQEAQQRQQQQADQDYNDALQRAQSQQQASVAQGQQVLQTWQNRPPLPPARNPLLGRWNSLGAPGSGPPGPDAGNDIAALAEALVGGLQAGLCDSMLGQGLVEFRPTSVVALGPGGGARLLYHASYRGGGSRVVVLPQGGTNFTHMIIDFDRPGHGVVAGAGCVVTQASGSGMSAATMGAANSGSPGPTGRAASTARTEPTLRNNYDYVCDRGLRIVVEQCRRDSDTPGSPPTAPQDDYCSVYYPDRPKTGGIYAMEIVLRGTLIETLQACGAL